MARLRDYFNSVSDQLAARSTLAGQVPHRPSIGDNRERVLIEFLERHSPRRLRPFRGGHAFGWDESESRQIDIMLSNDSTLSFDDELRTFVPIETLGAAISVKSTLDRASVTDALENLASIPAMNPRLIQVEGQGFERFAASFPRLFVVAYDSYAPETCREDVDAFYQHRPSIPENRRPTFIIGGQRFFLARDRVPFRLPSGERIEPGRYGLFELSEQTRGLPLALLADSLSGYVSWQQDLSFHLHLQIMRDYGVSIMQEVS